MPALNDDELQELKENFEYFDRDGNGRIDRNEFTELLEGLDAGMTQDELDVGFSLIDVNRSGSIDFDEFVRWWQDR